MALHVIVLAAGKGTRMSSDTAKVLHEAAGRPLISWALEIIEPLDAAKTVVVIGHQAATVAGYLPEGVLQAVQAEQRGTGHATAIGLEALDVARDDVVLVVPGDMPLIRTTTLRRLLDTHVATAAAATVLSCVMTDPNGYGRIIRTGEAVVRIVEEGDAKEWEKDVTEVNTSVYAFCAATLGPALARLDTENAQKEQYLTDVIGALVGAGYRVSAVVGDEVEGLGVNTRQQLEAATAELLHRALMSRGDR